MRIPNSTFKFLSDLKKNNNRDWFLENKPRYMAAHESAVDFAEKLIEEMNKQDQIEIRSGKKTLFRIYRDIRFSKDKTPFKTSFAGSLKRETKLLRGGYYFHLEPGNTIIAGGFWGPNGDDMKLIREAIARDDKPLRKIIGSKKFKDYFGELIGDTVKTAPKGYSKDHPAIDLIRHKQFLVKRKFTDKQVLEEDFIKHAAETFKAMRPFFDYMSEVLTTDADGVPLYN